MKVILMDLVVRPAAWSSMGFLGQLHVFMNVCEYFREHHYDYDYLRTKGNLWMLDAPAQVALDTSKRITPCYSSWILGRLIIEAYVQHISPILWLNPPD